jgi:hypothetical protein
MHMHHSAPQFRSRKQPSSLNLGVNVEKTAATLAEEAYELESPTIQFGDEMAILIESIFEHVDTDALGEN